MRALLLAGGCDEKIGFSWSRRPESPLIEAYTVCRRGADVTCFANADGRANGIDETLIDAVVADPGRQVRRRYCGSADKGWLLHWPLILRAGSVRGNQNRHEREQAQHVIPLRWLRRYGLYREAERNVTP
jgi:hypothetical protein